MMARLILKYKLTDADGDLTEMTVWRVPVDYRYPAGVRYRLAYIPAGYTRPVVLYDNHHPKGHHKHVGGDCLPYRFSGVGPLVDDFEGDIAHWRRGRG